MGPEKKKEYQVFSVTKPIVFFFSCCKSKGEKYVPLKKEEILAFIYKEERNV